MSCCQNCEEGKTCVAVLPKESWLVRFGGALSQLANVTFFNGHPNESVSARAWREQRRRWVAAINAITFNAAHCEESHALDVAWAQQLLKVAARKETP